MDLSKLTYVIWELTTCRLLHLVHHVKMLFKDSNDEVQGLELWRVPQAYETTFSLGWD